MIGRDGWKDLVFSKNLMSDLGRSCLIWIGCKIKVVASVQAYVQYIFGVEDRVNLILLGYVSMSRLYRLGMNGTEKAFTNYMSAYCVNANMSNEKSSTNLYNP